MHLKLVSATKAPRQIEVPQLHGVDPWRRGKVVGGEDRLGSTLCGCGVGPRHWLLALHEWG
jgi:hypothetical protein